MPVRQLPNLTPQQVVGLQDALLANADRLLPAALTLLDRGDVGVARSLAVLGMEESGKAIALHQRRVEMAYEPENTLFVNDRLQNLWASHQEKLSLVHSFLEDEEYWFGTEPADTEANLASLGTIKRWTGRHDTLKQHGFYVDIDKAGNVLDTTGAADRTSLSKSSTMSTRSAGSSAWVSTLRPHDRTSPFAGSRRGPRPRLKRCETCSQISIWSWTRSSSSR